MTGEELERDVRTLRVPTNVSRIEVHAPDGRMLKQIVSSGEIQRVLAFLESHRKHWEYSNTGFPTPPLELLFYRLDQRLGQLGAGRYGAACHRSVPGYFESDLPRNGQPPLYGIEVSDDDLHAFLALVGLPEYSLDVESCM